MHKKQEKKVKDKRRGEGKGGTLLSSPFDRKISAISSRYEGDGNRIPIFAKLAIDDSKELLVVVPHRLKKHDFVQDKVAATVSALLRHSNIQPIIRTLPTLESIGKCERWYPSGVRR